MCSIQLTASAVVGFFEGFAGAGLAALAFQLLRERMFHIQQESPFSYNFTLFAFFVLLAMVHIVIGTVWIDLISGDACSRSGVGGLWNLFSLLGMGLVFALPTYEKWLRKVLVGRRK